MCLLSVCTVHTSALLSNFLRLLTNHPCSHSHSMTLSPSPMTPIITLSHHLHSLSLKHTFLPDVMFHTSLFHHNVRRYVPIPKMDDFRPSIIIQKWMIIADHAKIIQIWMILASCSLKGTICSIIIQFRMIHAIHYWMIYYTVIKHPFLDDSCHPLLDDLLHCHITCSLCTFKLIQANVSSC